jgi:hypothetical protein
MTDGSKNRKIHGIGKNQFNKIISMFDVNDNNNDNERHGQGCVTKTKPRSQKQDWAENKSFKSKLMMWENKYQENDDVSLYGAELSSSGNTMPGVSAPRSNAVSAPRSNAVSAPRSNAVSAPRSNAVSAPRSNAVSAPRSNAVSAPRSNAVSAPRSNAVSAPRSNAVSAPRSNAGAGKRKQPNIETPIKLLTEPQDPRSDQTIPGDKIKITQGIDDGQGYGVPGNPGSPQVPASQEPKINIGMDNNVMVMTKKKTLINLSDKNNISHDTVSIMESLETESTKINTIETDSHNLTPDKLTTTKINKNTDEVVSKNTNTMPDKPNNRMTRTNTNKNSKPTSNKVVHGSVTEKPSTRKPDNNGSVTGRSTKKHDIKKPNGIKDNKPSIVVKNQSKVSEPSKANKLNPRNTESDDDDLFAYIPVKKNH